MNDTELENLYDDYLQFTGRMCADHSPMAVAAIMMTQALSIYKTTMTVEDYNQMVDSISANRNQVKTFERPILQ